MELIGFGKITNCEGVKQNELNTLNLEFTNCTLQVMRDRGLADSDLLENVNELKAGFDKVLVPTLVRNFMETVQGKNLCEKLKTLIKGPNTHENVLQNFGSQASFIQYWLIENLYNLQKTSREAFEDKGLARDLYYDALMAHRFTEKGQLTNQQKAKILLKSVEISKDLLNTFRVVEPQPNMARTSDPMYIQYMEDLVNFPAFRNSEILKHPTIFAKYAEIKAPNLIKLKAELKETQKSKRVYQGLFAGSLVLSGILAYKLYKNSRNQPPKIRFPEPGEEGHQYVQLELPIKR